MVQNKRRQGGYILVTMAAGAFSLFGAMGVAIDVGRLFIIRNETQAYCDAAALAAALELNGTSQGITAATSAALNVGNKYNIDSSALTTQCVTSGNNTITTNCVTVDFAQTQNGTYSSNPSNASGYIYARVQTSVNANLYFMPALLVKFTSGPGYIQKVNALAIAGQIDLSTTQIKNGAMPYTAVSTNPSQKDFGFTVGGLYDMQWPQYNANRGHCAQGDSLSHLEDCFNSTPCSGDLNSATLKAVTQSWGASTNGYWGYNSNSDIAGTVLGTNQIVPVALGDNLQAMPETTANCNSAPCNVLTNGNKAVEAGILDARASGDDDVVLAGSNNGTGNGNCSNSCWNNVDGLTTISDYFFNDNPLGNGRRTFLVPVVYPGCANYNTTTQTCGSTGTTTSTAVIGWGEFLLYSKGTSGNSTWYKDNLQGNDPFCAIYVGPWTGPEGNGSGSSSGGSGAYRVKLVQ